MKIKQKNNDLENSETKRAHGFNEIVERHKQQKNLIKSALSNVDSTSTNKKIIFNDELELSHQISNGHSNISESNKRKKLIESEDEESDVDINFDEKIQYAGERGQKLLNLKSRFNNDERFTIDKRFIEDNDVNKNGEDDGAEDNVLQNEKSKELEILNDILKKNIKFENKKVTKNDQLSMIRFDPALPKHSKFIVPETEKKVKKKKTIQETVIAKQNENDKPLPEVSKELFYQIDDSLKETLQNKQSFSLLAMFGTAEDTNKEQIENQSETLKKSKHSLGPNPFHYDSSDDEEEKEEQTTENTKENKEENDTKPQIRNMSTGKLWTEPFFFQHNDFRLQEGVDFIKRIAEKDQTSDFRKVRRDLKDIIKSKVRNNKKRNKMFKKKLGGNKRRKILRLKKALKR